MFKSQEALYEFGHHGNEYHDAAHRFIDAEIQHETYYCAYHEDDVEYLSESVHDFYLLSS